MKHIWLFSVVSLFSTLKGLFIWARLTGLARFPRSRLTSKSFGKTLMCSYERSGWLGYRDLGFSNRNLDKRAGNFAIWTLHPGYREENKTIYYMTSSVSGQDEPNRALWLATRAGKMERYCPLGISRLVPQDQRSFFGVLSHIINPLLTKIVRSRWLDIGLVLFLRVYGPRLCLGP